MDTCYAYGTNPSQLRQRYMEAHDLVVRAWTEKDTFAFNGRFNQQRYVNIWPRPVQQPHPPIWIPGGGSVETWRWCAEMDYVYCYLSYYGYKAGRATMDGFWAEMERLGKERNPYQAGFLQFVGVGESRQHAFDLYAEAAEYFYGRCLHVDPRWATPPGYTSEGSQRAGIESQVKQAADANVRGKSTGERFASVAREMEAIVDNGYVIIGSPDEVAEQLREVAVNLNVGHLMLLLQFGNMNKDLTRYNTQMFAEQVMPKLKDLHADWDDRWWPKPMQAAQRADDRRVPAQSRRRINRRRTEHHRERTSDVDHRRQRLFHPRLAQGHRPEARLPGRVRRVAALDAVLDELAKSRTVIVPSLPGFPGGDRGHSVLDSHLDWMLAVREMLEKSDLVGADLAGSSVGASLALEVAALWPASVRRLAVIAPFGLFDEANPPTDPWAQRGDQVPGLMCADPEIWNAMKAAPEGANSIEWPIEQTRAAEAAARIFWPLGNTRIEKRLGLIQAPVLLLWGENDRIMPRSYTPRRSRAASPARPRRNDRGRRPSGRTRQAGRGRPGDPRFHSLSGEEPAAWRLIRTPSLSST